MPYLKSPQIGWVGGPYRKSSVVDAFDCTLDQPLTLIPIIKVNVCIKIREMLFELDSPAAVNMHMCASLSGVM